jgi:D-alanyl-D-alanine carboxypeptidase
MPRARSVAAVTVLVALIAVPLAPPAAADAPKWVERIDHLVGEHPMSVAIGNDGDYWYRHAAWTARPPASNQKLLLSMALLDSFPPTRTIRTRVMTSAPIVDGVVQGDLWLVSRGDPENDRTGVAAPAKALADAGIRRVRGSVLGSTGPFVRDWWATGWREYFPTYYIPIPTALVFARNEDAFGRNIADPELRAAAFLAKRMEQRGIKVRRGAGVGVAPPKMRVVTQRLSAPLQGIMRRMNVYSRNLWAEVLGKYLGDETSANSTIAGGAGAVCAFTAANGESFVCHDNSGLSYANRARAVGILRLLWLADTRAWGPVLRATLPSGGQGTLKDRLLDVRLRAKTGTLQGVSALSGWVWLRRSEGWAEFSILSSGMSPVTAKSIEDQILRVVSANAADPDPTG